MEYIKWGGSARDGTMILSDPEGSARPEAVGCSCCRGHSNQTGGKSESQRYLWAALPVVKS